GGALLGARELLSRVQDGVDPVCIGRRRITQLLPLAKVLVICAHDHVGQRAAREIGYDSVNLELRRLLDGGAALGGGSDRSRRNTWGRVYRCRHGRTRHASSAARNGRRAAVG